MNLNKTKWAFHARYFQLGQALSIDKGIITYQGLSLSIRDLIENDSWRKILEARGKMHCDYPDNCVGCLKEEKTYTQIREGVLEALELLTKHLQEVLDRLNINKSNK